MKIITVNEIEKVLDNYLIHYLEKEFEFKNVIFFGEEGIGKTSVIEKWLEKNKDNIALISGLYPMQVFKEKENGIIVPEEAERYELPYTREIDNIINQANEVLYYERFNDNLFDKYGNERIADLVCKRLLNNYVTGESHFAKWFLCIMEALPVNEVHTNISNIPEIILNSSDIYYVEPSVKEFKEYLLSVLEQMKEEQVQYGKNVADIENSIHIWAYILSSEDFHFFFDANNYFSPLNVEMCVNIISLEHENSDIQSLKSQIIDFCKRQCYGEDVIKMLKNILDNYNCI